MYKEINIQNINIVLARPRTSADEIGIRRDIGPRWSDK